MTMTRGNWETKTNYYDGKKYYQVARLYDVNQSGHYEFLNADFPTKEDARAFADRLNAEKINDVYKASELVKQTNNENTEQPTKSDDDSTEQPTKSDDDSTEQPTKSDDDSTEMAKKPSEPKKSNTKEENKKKAIVVSIMGRLVKKTPSRHYWLYDGTKWIRIGLTRIANELKISADVIKAAIFTATKKALENIAAAEHSGSHASVLYFESLALTLFAVVYFLCYSIVGEDEGFFIATPISQGLALWLYHKVTTVFRDYKGGATL